MISMLKLTLHGANITFTFSKVDKERLLTKRDIWQATRHTEGSGFDLEGKPSDKATMTNIAYTMALAKIVMIKKLTGIEITGDYDIDIEYK